MARYGADYGREYEAWGGGGQWGQGGQRGGFLGGQRGYGQGGFGQGGRQGYRESPRPYGSDYLGADESYGYEEWGDRFSPRQGRGRGGMGEEWTPERDPYGGFSGGGYRTFQRDYGEDYRFGGAPGRQGAYRAGPGGYASGYQGGYEGGYTGGYGTAQTGGWSGRRAAPSRASEIMTENPEVVTADTTIAEVAARMKELDVGIIPVVESMDNRRLSGVITDRDIAIRAVAEGKDGKMKVSECMTPRVESVNKNDDIERVLQVMEQQQVRRVPVTDREGRVVGIIAQADLAVDYGQGRPRDEMRVEHVLERISAPAHPRRGGAAMQAGARSGAREQKEDRSEKKR